MTKLLDDYLSPRGIIENVPLEVSKTDAKPIFSHHHGKNNDGTICYVVGRTNATKIIQSLEDAGFKIVVENKN
jgi:hypothetical protein